MGKVRDAPASADSKVTSCCCEADWVSAWLRKTRETDGLRALRGAETIGTGKKKYQPVSFLPSRDNEEGAEVRYEAHSEGVEGNNTTQPAGCGVLSSLPSSLTLTLLPACPPTASDEPRQTQPKTKTNRRPHRAQQRWKDVN